MRNAEDQPNFRPIWTSSCQQLKCFRTKFSYRKLILQTKQHSSKHKYNCKGAELQKKFIKDRLQSFKIFLCCELSVLILCLSAPFISLSHNRSCLIHKLLFLSKFNSCHCHIVFITQIPTLQLFFVYFLIERSYFEVTQRVTHASQIATNPSYKHKKPHKYP